MLKRRRIDLAGLGMEWGIEFSLVVLSNVNLFPFPTITWPGLVHSDFYRVEQNYEINQKLNSIF